jgi:acetaldehyde dehydrogenase (acetylating)
LTAPEPVAAEDGEEDAAALELAALAEVAAGALDVAAGALDELEELHPAAAKPRKAAPTTASRARGDRNVNMITTLASATCGAQQALTVVFRTVTSRSVAIAAGLRLPDIATTNRARHWAFITMTASNGRRMMAGKLR